LVFGGGSFVFGGGDVFSGSVDFSVDLFELSFSFGFSGDVFFKSGGDGDFEVFHFLDDGFEGFSREGRGDL